MLDATESETATIKAYVASRAPDREVTFLQKMRVENVQGIRHEVWDVHCDNSERWWVITNPTNLYSQEQFPNMDVAITFHVGLCLRIPRTERRQVSERAAEPFGEFLRLMMEATDALAQAQGIADFQAVGVRCRETLLAFTDAAQVVVPWSASDQPPPKRADFKAWAEHVCNTTMPGGQHAERRSLFKALLRSAWDFSNWLTHARRSTLHDTEAAVTSVEHALGLTASLVIRHLRQVPDTCPACGSSRLSPERGIRTDDPDVEWERPVCDKCGWHGNPIRISEVPLSPAPTDGDSRPDSECVIQTVPVRSLRSRPKRKPS